LKEVTLQEFKEFFEKHFYSENSKRIDIELTAEAHNEKQAEWKAKNHEAHFKGGRRTEVTDSLNVFKKNMPLHPDTFKANYASHKL
jgi:hypothetical protein